jgi:hypothetical protein
MNFGNHVKRIVIFMKVLYELDFKKFHELFTLGFDA